MPVSFLENTSEKDVNVKTRLSVVIPSEGIKMVYRRFEEENLLLLRVRVIKFLARKFKLIIQYCKATDKLVSINISMCVSF